MTQRLENTANKLFENGLTRSLAQILYVVARGLAKVAHVKYRYVLTRNNQLRLRYVTAVTTFLFAAIISFSITSHREEISAFDLAMINPAAGHPDILAGLPDRIGFENFKAISIAPEQVTDPLPLDREVLIESGDSLGRVLEKQGIGREEATKIITEMKEHFDPRSIKVGQKISMHFDDIGPGEQALREMSYALDPIKTLVVARADGGFVTKLDEKEVQKIIKAQKAEVKISLYGSAAQAGIPNTIVANAIHIFSWGVDFQRDIRPNDTLEVMYESFETEEGHISKLGDILYAKITLGDREIPLYQYKMSDGRVEYFQPDGRSIKRTLMKTPINGARMSSGFGNRRHPVLGYTKMHKGVDFAAPTGTPIFAAGDGVVVKSGWFSSYGKYVQIRHNGKLQTAYAHMSKIAPGTKIGSRVKQGDIIGYVGTTGRSTGPHLHYEVMVNGTQVNPRSVNLPTGEELSGKELARFKAVMDERRRQYASLLDKTKLASRQENRRFFP